MSLFAELQRRSVFKVAVAYLVVGWLVIQVAATVAPQMGLPDWAPRFVTLIVLLGFPVALVLAWVFDVTPDGLKADPAPVGNKRVYATAAVLAALALGWYYRAELPIGQSGAPALAQSPRLAVLPLANFSPDPENAFFADGLHDDLLTALSRMKGVDVISRTTMQTFKDSKKKLADIASEVGATQVLEGSVRRDATRVRLTVQLIDARNDDHLWAETYDRPLADALTLQNEVAQGVAKAMKVAIANGADDAPPTAVTGAYDLFLKARLTSAREDRLQLLSSALLLDPNFTQARALRAATACLVLWYDETRSVVLAPQARADIERARAERPELPELDVAEAYYRYYVERDWKGALAKAEAALAKDANNGEALGARGFLLRRLGRRDEAIASGQRRYELDPNNAGAAYSLMDLFQHYKRPRDALAIAESMLTKLPADSEERRGFEGARGYLKFLITGDRVALALAIEALRARTPEDQWLQDRFANQDPSAERLAWLKQRAASDPWQKADDGALYPSALDVANEADYLGDAATRTHALEESARLYATLSPKVMARPFSIAWHAVHLALAGDAKAAVAEAQRAVDSATPDKDATATGQVDMLAVWVFARAGETQPALDLLEQAVDRPGVSDAFTYHDAFLRQQLGKEPRYQALMARLAAKFEKL